MLTLKAEKRDLKISPNKVRKDGRVPAVVYGRTEQSTPITLLLSEFTKVWKQAGETSIIGLDIPGKKLNVLIHDVAVDPVRDNPIHADFYAIEAGQTVEVKIPLEFVGVSPAVKDLAGVLVRVLQEIEVSCLPENLPQSIQVDISPLATFDSLIYVKDLPVPKGVTFNANSEDVVASISKQEEEIIEEVAPVFDASAIEVEKKGKKEEEGVPGEGEAPAKEEKK